MHVFPKQTWLIWKTNAQSSVPLKNKLCSFLTIYAALHDTQQRYAHQINNDVTHHVTHSSRQARTTRKKFPIKASVESMSHVLDLRFWLRLYTYIYWSTSTMSNRRMSYTASEKLAIVKYAEAHGNRAAGWHGSSLLLKYMHAFEQAFEIDRTSESYFKRKLAVWRLSSVVTNLKTVGLSYSPIVATNFEIRYIRAVGQVNGSY